MQTVRSRINLLIIWVLLFLLTVLTQQDTILIISTLGIVTLKLLEFITFITKMLETKLFIPLLLAESMLLILCIAANIAIAISTGVGDNLLFYPFLALLLLCGPIELKIQFNIHKKGEK